MRPMRSYRANIHLMTIKTLMGHSSISSTAKYLYVAQLTGGVVSPLDLQAKTW